MLQWEENLQHHQLWHSQLSQIFLFGLCVYESPQLMTALQEWAFIFQPAATKNKTLDKRA